MDYYYYIYIYIAPYAELQLTSPVDSNSFNNVYDAVTVSL